MDTAPDLGLDNRTGWPSELRILLRKFPRATWPDHVNLRQLARFWLSIHDGFRGYGAKLGEATVDLREGKVPPERFRVWFAPTSASSPRGACPNISKYPATAMDPEAHIS